MQISKRPRIWRFAILGLLVLAGAVASHPSAGAWATPLRRLRQEGPVQYGLHLAREGAWQFRRAWARVNGQLVDVGGYRLYISCRGAGAPIVVMDAGLGQSGRTWNNVTAGIAAFTRVCVYDRRGIGLSDALPTGIDNRTARDVVADLRSLLHEHGVPAPFVLVGHSTGGLNVRLYANYHPGEVAGLVLVDGSHENQFERLALLMADEARRKYLDHESGRNLERLNLVESGSEVRRARELPPVPLSVLSSTRGEPSATLHRELQADLARLRPDARHMVVETGHFIQNEAPAVVVEAIREAIRDAQRSRGQQAQ